MKSLGLYISVNILGPNCIQKCKFNLTFPFVLSSVPILDPTAVILGKLTHSFVMNDNNSISGGGGGSLSVTLGPHARSKIARLGIFNAELM